MMRFFRWLFGWDEPAPHSFDAEPREPPPNQSGFLIDPPYPGPGVYPPVFPSVPGTGKRGKRRSSAPLIRYSPPIPDSTSDDGFAEGLLLAELLSDSPAAESPAEPFSGDGGDFGGAGASGDWSDSSSSDTSSDSYDSSSSDSSDSGDSSGSDS